MAYLIVPLTPNANQSFACTLPIDSENKKLFFSFRYNTVAGYWFMSVSDAITNQLLIDAVPLVTGDFPAADLLGQYGYMGIGSAAIVPASSLATDRPDDTNLGTDYVLVWGDTVV